MKLLVDAWRDLRAHPGKAVMTALSLFIAVLALVGVDVEGTISRTAVIARDEQQTGRAPTMTAYVTVSKLGGRDLDDLFRALDHRVGGGLRGSWVASFDLKSSIAVSRAGGELGSNTNVYLVSGDLGGIRRLPLLSGRFLGADEPDRAQVAVVNTVASAALGGVGDRLQARSPSQAFGAPAVYDIVGVIDDGIPAPTVYLPIESWRRFDPSLAGAQAVEFFAHSGGTSDEVLGDAMRAAFADVGVTPENDINRFDNADNFEFSRKAVEQAFLAASLITLLVAVVGMTNIGLSSIRERTREYAVRRAFGFTRRRVVLLVLAVNLVLGLIASGLAMVVAVLATKGVIPGFQHSDLVGLPPFPWKAAVAATAAGLGASLLGGLAPAVAVTKVDVAELLR